MAAATLLQPDLNFKQRILSLGGADLTACYQCGTCSVVCPISTADNPFPRKEMVWVQWGLKDLALSNPSIWLCHRCGTCSAYCPRDARPSEVMAALREYSIGHYASPTFMGRALSEPKYLPLLFAIPIIILLIALGLLGRLAALPEGQVVFSKFMSTTALEVIFIVATALALVGAALGGARYWKAMSRLDFGFWILDFGLRTGRPQSKIQNPKSKIQLIPTLLDILQHRKFRQCQAEPVGTRRTHQEHLFGAHLAIFYGFLGLTLTTASVMIGLYVFGYFTPWPLWHPVKILGNVSGAAVAIALVVFALRRNPDQARPGKNTYSDWLFLWILFLTVGTGFLSQGLRMLEMAVLAYPTYFMHLVFVFFLLAYIPYTKFAHLVYRTVALLYAAPSGVAERSRPQALAGASAPPSEGLAP
ncbi:MAG: quinone-interacting membrane-bound oxidoreductase complex subunit QmoC [Chloroflexi bacterium]|nr:quinone-interacting membrane-bound oxidoreductase complex subunit QmoC [Chloroflexota bacterium]